MGSLLKVLEGYHLGNIDEEDECLWLLDRDRGFSIKSMYLAVLNFNLPCPSRFIWNPHVHSRVFFLWLL